MDQFRHFNAGETIFRQGDSGDVAYLIREGEVAIIRHDGSEDRVLATLRPGDLFGEMAVIDERPRSATAKAVSPVTAMVISAAQFNDRMEHIDPLIANLLQTFLQRLGGGGVIGRETRTQDLERAQSTLRQRAIAKMQAEAELKSAVEQQQFELHYQPIIDLELNQVAGFEALIRWRKPDGSLVPPMAFIPIAEETNLILPMGQWALEEAMRGLQRLQAAVTGAAPDTPPLFVCVNVAARQFNDPAFPGHVANALQDSGCVPRQVKLEVTESALVRDAEFAADQMRACANLGCQISLDDFGTGYSSFAYLSRFPIDVMKIDRIFVQDMMTQRRSTAIVRGICGIAKGLEVPIVAEGIEDEEHVTALRAMGCEFGQGFFYSRPMPEADALDYLNKAFGRP